MEAYWTYSLSTDMAGFVHCEPRWYLIRVIALRMGGMQQYGISVSIFEQGNLQGNSSGPSDPPGLLFACLLFLPPGAFRQLSSQLDTGLSLYTRNYTHHSYPALTPACSLQVPSQKLIKGPSPKFAASNPGAFQRLLEGSRRSRRLQSASTAALEKHGGDKRCTDALPN